MRAIIISLTLLAALPAHALDLTITLPSRGDIAIDRLKASYDCSGATFEVEYINAGLVSLAVFEYDGAPFVAANVLSASGARYAGGHLIWWTKGAEGSLYDLTLGEDAAPILQCTEAN
jgi:membrane-bound inhibitor of C-type lysozyme